MHPESITNDSRTGVLEIAWQDGSVQRLGHAFLRASCRCADCQSRQMTGALPPASGSGMRITRIAPVGSYAVQLVFCDGHMRGIYPYAYLRQLKDHSIAPAAQAGLTQCRGSFEPVP